MPQNISHNLPLISVLITAYNYEHTLHLAIESALEQDYPNVEIIVIDNASTDATAEVVSRYTHDQRLRYIRNETNIGMIPNHNKALREARGAFTTFLAADNCMMPGYLSRAQAYFAKHPDTEIVYSGIYLMSASGRILHRRENELNAGYHGGRDELPILLGYGCDMQIESMLIHRSVWERHGYLHEELIAADYEIILRWAAEHVQFAYLPDPFIAYRIHENQQSSVKNYVATGKQLVEYLSFVDRYLWPQFAARLRGFENAILAHLDTKYQDALRVQGFDAQEYDSFVVDLRQRIIGIRDYNRVTAFRPRITVLVIASSNVYSLEHSLTSLLAQTHDDWEALVIQQPGISFEGVCQRIDPQRIRVVRLIEAASESAALNTGILIAGGNCFTFLRAGSAFAPHHLAQLYQAMTDAPQKVALSETSVTITSPSLEQYVADDAFPGYRTIDETLVAPVVPIEALAFHRSAIDECRSFHLDYAVASHWELLLRFIKKHEVQLIQSYVELNSILGYKDLLLVDERIISTVQRVYATYPAENNRVSELRQQYLTSLMNLFGTLQPPAQSPYARLYEYQTISGKTVLNFRAQESFA
jgi:glycosyltransferase involved in cell wall biosynthesis